MGKSEYSMYLLACLAGTYFSYTCIGLLGYVHEKEVYIYVTPAMKVSCRLFPAHMAALVYFVNLMRMSLNFSYIQD